MLTKGILSSIVRQIGDYMSEFFAKLLDFLSPDKRVSVPKLGIFILILLLLMPIVLKYFYENIKTEQEIRILKELIEIERNDINDPRLLKYYNSILDSLNKENIFGFNIIDDKPSTIGEYLLPRNIYKFISGSIWCILLFIICIFVKHNDKNSKIIALILLLLLIFLFGLAGVNIPSFSPLAINIIGFPFIQILLIISIVIVVNKRKGKKNSVQ